MNGELIKSLFLISKLCLSCMNSLVLISAFHYQLIVSNSPYSVFFV